MIPLAPPAGRLVATAGDHECDAGVQTYLPTHSRCQKQSAANDAETAQHAHRPVYRR